MDKNSDINILTNYLQEQIEILEKRLDKAYRKIAILEECLDVRLDVYDRLLADYMNLKKKRTTVEQLDVKKMESALLDARFLTEET
jgi:hypothetical protein